MSDLDPVKARKEKKFWDRTLLYSLGTAVALLLVLVGVLFWQGANQRDDFDALADEFTAVRTDKIDLCDEKVNAKKPECATNVPPVDEVAPDADPQATPTVIVQQLPATVIRQTLPATEVRKAVLRVCGGSCKGRDVTADMVAEGIVAYCSSGICTPQPGKDGADAPPPSDAQVQAGVAAYCQENDCKGDPGPLCPDGYEGGVLSVMTSLTESREIFACIAASDG